MLHIGIPEEYVRDIMLEALFDLLVSGPDMFQDRFCYLLICFW
jgi:hypothetical protein